MKVWVTKDVLRQPLRQVTGHKDYSNPNVFVAVAAIDISQGAKRPERFRGEGEEWHRTKVAAKNKAERMREAKITELKKQIAKQIAKLEALRF